MVRVLRDGGHPEAFFRAMSGKRRRVLFLDYDGTLAPFTPDRNRAFPYPGVTEVVDAIVAGSACEVVFVSGRPVADLQRLITLRRYPEMWGTHGWEHREPSGETAFAALDAARRGTVSAFGAALATAGLSARLERKEVGLAVHWRGAVPEEADRIESTARAAWSSLGAPSGMELHRFDGGLEVRPTGKDKGSAVREVVERDAADLCCAYLGDDLTDEDAFRALGPVALKVLVRPTLRDTLADLWLEPPAELLDFLRAWQEHCPRRLPGTSVG